MQLYFSYGSNMSRSRLEERTGAVIVHGPASLTGFRHRFSHRGQDGSAKGNIEAQAGDSVFGVLYALTSGQVEVLHAYEGGYEIVSVEVSLWHKQSVHQAYTYHNPEPSTGLRPLESYLEHYLSGMREHEFPADYIASIRKQSGL